MRRRSNSHSPISLFTFLDTLVCTMGSLILMLLAMTPKIRERAEARELARLAALTPAVQSESEALPAEAVVVAAPAALLPSAEDEHARAAERQRRRDAWLASLAESRQTLANKQAEYHRQRLALKEAGGLLKDLQDRILKTRAKDESAADANQSLTDLETRLEEQQARIAQRIALTRKNIDLLNRQQSEKANEYALVPYDGSSGTVRRPIYVECSNKGFRFLPEDETVSPVDLKGFQEGYNPLLTGTQTLLRYWTRRRREAGGAEPEPYVLLLVRPSGCLNYYVARGFLSSLGANFGYELIEEDWKLSIPHPDPVAKAVLKETLDRTVQAQSEIRNTFVDAAQRGGFGNGRNSRRGGGFDDSLRGEDEDDFGMPSSGTGRRGNRKPSIQFGPATRRNRDGSGLAGDGDPERNSRGGSGAGEAGAGLSEGSKSGAGTGRGALAGTPRNTGLGGKAVASRPAGIDGGAKTGIGGRRGGNGGGVDGEARAGAGDDSLFVSRQPDGGTADGIPGGSGGGESGSYPSGQPSAGLSDSLSGAPREANPGGGQRGGTRGGRPGRVGSRPATLGGSSANSGTGDGSGAGDEPLQIPPDYVPGEFPGEEGSGGTGSDLFPFRPLPQNSNDGSASDSSGEGGSSVPPAPGSSGLKSKTGSASSGSPTSGEKGSASGAADSTAASDLLTSGSDSGDASPGGSPPGQLQMGGPGATLRLGSQGKRKESDKEDPDAGRRLAEEDAKTGGPRGRAMGPRLWGRARARATIGLERKLEIRILADRILVGSKDIVIPVGNGETVEEMINHVVAGIDRAADKWGDPPASFYWLPTVRFVVYPGGNQYYEKLHETLQHKWGVTSTLEYAPAKPDAKVDGKTNTRRDAKGDSKSGIQPAGGPRP
jgi:hypothetical protein